MELILGINRDLNLVPARAAGTTPLIAINDLCKAKSGTL